MPFWVRGGGHYWYTTKCSVVIAIEECRHWKVVCIGWVCWGNNIMLFRGNPFATIGELLRMIFRGVQHCRNRFCGNGVLLDTQGQKRHTVSIIMGASNNLLQSEKTGELFLGPILREQCFGGHWFVFVGNGRSWIQMKQNNSNSFHPWPPGSRGRCFGTSRWDLHCGTRDMRIQNSVKKDECINTKTVISRELKRSSKRLKTFWGSYSLGKVSVSDSLLIASLLITREVVECYFGGFQHLLLGWRKWMPSLTQQSTTLHHRVIG